MKTQIRRISLLFIILILTSACATFKIIPNTTGDGGWLDWDEEGGWSGTSRTAIEEGESVFADEPPMEVAPLLEPLSSDAEKAVVAADDSSVDGRETLQNTALRAGSVDDNAEWDDYLLYRLQFSEWGIYIHDLDVTERHIIQVNNDNGQPVLGAKVTVLDSNERELAVLRTYSDGRVLFFPKTYNQLQAQSFQVSVEKDGVATTFSLDRTEREHFVTLEVRSASDPVRLDVHFLIDATGSMSDEIQQLKDNMVSVSERIHSLPSNPNVRFGMTIYRDRGDQFVSRSFDFTPDIQAFTSEIKQVIADGGGDYPESLNEGLHNAIHLPEWRVEETVSLIFLVADAPPHLDYANDYDYAEEVYEAARLGIKIFPLASSGLDDQGEYIFRQLAQVSSGKFLFLTYGAGGAPGDDTPHHVEDYSVLSLDELVVRLVEEELAHLHFEQ